MSSIADVLRGPLESLTDVAALKAQDVLGRLSKGDWTLVQRATGPYSGLAGLAEGGGPWEAIYASCPGVSCAIAMRRAEAQALAQAYLFKSVDPGEDWLDRRAELVENLGEPAISEVGNIVAHSVAVAWADACRVGFILSAPKTSVGSAAEVRAALEARLAAAKQAPALTIALELRSSALAASCSMRLFLSEAMAEKLAARRGAGA